MVELPLLLSVVVPVHHGAATLRRCCEALAASDLPREQWELIVVADSCSDDSTAIAAEFADTLIRLSDGPYGAAYARNRGAEVARAELVAFVSADVLVESGTLRLFVATLLSSGASAVTVVGAPADGLGVAARYQGACAQFVEMRTGGVGDAFTACCAAVRKTSYLDAGLFDEWRTGSPRTDALEFGHRLRACGCEIRHVADVAPVRHVRATTLSTLLGAAWHDHGCFVPDGGALPPAPNRELSALRRVERVTIALLWVTLLTLLWGLWSANSALLFAAMAGFGAVALLEARLLTHLVRSAPWHQAPFVLLLHPVVLLVRGAGRVMWTLNHQLVGERRPAAHIEAWTEVGATKWPPVPNRRPADTRRPPALPS